MLLRGAVCPNFYRDFMAAAAAKNRPLPAGMAGFVEPCILMEKSPDKKQIATAPMCRGSFVSGRSYRSLGCQSQSAKIISSRSPVMNLFSIVSITLLSFPIFHLYYMHLRFVLQVQNYIYFTIFVFYFLINCTVPLALSAEIHYNMWHSFDGSARNAYERVFGRTI